MVCFVRLKHPKDFCLQELSFILSGWCDDLIFSLTFFHLCWSSLNAELDHEHGLGSSVNEAEATVLSCPRAVLSIWGTVYYCMVVWGGAAQILTLQSCHGVWLTQVLAVQGRFPPVALASPAPIISFHACTIECKSKNRGRPEWLRGEPAFCSLLLQREL